MGEDDICQRDYCRHPRKLHNKGQPCLGCMNVDVRDPRRISGPVAVGGCGLFLDVPNHRVYFVGGHATGKTTMARAVSRLYGLPHITEVARSVLAELETNFDTLRTDMDRVSDYQRKVFERQYATEQIHKGFVSDRAFDSLAYAAEHSLALPDIMPSVPTYMKWVSEGTVFFVRPRKELLEGLKDDVRERLDWDGIVRIDGMLKLLLQQFRVRYLPINTASMQERMDCVRYVLDAKGLTSVVP